MTTVPHDLESALARDGAREPDPVPRAGGAGTVREIGEAGRRPARAGDGRHPGPGVLDAKTGRSPDVTARIVPEITLPWTRS